MKTISFILTLVLSLPLNAFAKDGNESGNGGGAIVCIGRNNEKTVQLLDLREAEKELGLKIRRSDKPWTLQLEMALRRYEVILPDYVRLMREELENMNLNTEPSPNRLPPPTDTHLTRLNEPRNCFLEGVANYDDVRGKLIIDYELEKLMPETDKAALRFHEAWYKVQRSQISATSNSEAARRVTARIFAQNELQIEPRVLDFMEAISSCVSLDRKFAFYVAPKDDGVELNFIRVNGIVLGERTSIYIPEKQKALTEISSEGDILNSLREGFIPTTRQSNREDSVSRERKGTELIRGAAIYFTLNSKYAPPMRILITSTDWGTNDGFNAVEQAAATNNFEGTGKTSWTSKPAIIYDNFSNHISLDVPGTDITFAKYFRNGVNSRFLCSALQF